MYGILKTDIRVRIGHHINQDSKYWPGIRDKYVNEAGVYALRYFEAKTLSPHGLEGILHGDRHNARAMITLISKDVPIFPPDKAPDGFRGWAGDEDIKPDRGAKKHRIIHKRFKSRHNRSNIALESPKNWL